MASVAAPEASDANPAPPPASESKQDPVAAEFLTGAVDPIVKLSLKPGHRFFLGNEDCPAAHPEETSQAIVVRPDETTSSATATVYPRSLEAERQEQEFLAFVPNHFARVRVRSEVEYPEDRKVLRLKDMNPPDPSRILYLRLDNLASTVGPKTAATLGPMVSAFRNLQVLVLRSCGLAKLDNFELPDLTHCDLTQNDIRALGQVTTMAKNCPNIASFDLTSNPLLTTGEWKERGWSVVAMLTHLTHLNGSEVTLDQHILANRRHGSVDDQRRLALRIYDEAFMQRAAAGALATQRLFNTESWTPESVISLDLSKCQLQVFHVGTLVSLRVLNLAHNFLTRITMGGLAACGQLSSLDVTKNLLADHSNIEYLRLLPTLTVLRVAGNPLTEDRTHRLDIIYNTNVCRGSPTAPGLQMLDRKPVTLSERVQAFQKFCDINGARSKDIAAAIFKWRLILTAHFGQLAVDQLCNAGHGLPAGTKEDDPALQAAALETAQAAAGARPSVSMFAPLSNAHGPLTRLRMLVLQNQELSIVDVRGMSSLEVLDLRGNNLQGPGVLGLNELRHLRVLDLANNPLLAVEDVLSGLLGRVNDFGIPKLKTLAHEQPLTTLESVAVGLPADARLEGASLWWEDRTADPFLATTGASVKELVMKLVPNNRHLRRVEGTSLNPVAIAAAYQAALSWGTDTTLQYTARLAALMAIVPPVCMDATGSAVGAAGVGAGAAAGAGAGVSGQLVAGTNDQPPAQTLMHLRSHHPDHVMPGHQYDPAHVDGNLNFASLGLISENAIDLSMFKRLRILNLAYNKLTSLDSLGLALMPALEQLDLHGNRLKQLASLAELIDALPNLQMVAVRDNPCTRDFDASRVALLGLITRLRTADCTLRVVDVPVTLDERVEAWKTAGGSDADAEAFRAEVALQTRAPVGVPPGRVKELNLEGAKLQLVDLSAYQDLEQLSLRDNHFTLESMRAHGQAMGLPTLTKLVAVDLRENDFDFSTPANRTAVLNIVSALPALKSLGVCGNWDAADRRRIMRGRVHGDGVAPASPSGASDPAFSVTKQGRQEVLKLLPALKNPKCSLRFLDNVPISSAEIVDAFHSNLPEATREAHRFDIALGRELGDVPAEDTTTLNLSQHHLRVLRRQPMSQLQHLQYLYLHDNNLNDATLRDAGLDSLPIIHLDVRRNQLSNGKQLGALANRMRSLKELHCTGNPFFQDDTPENRVRLLSDIPRAGFRGFRMTINGSKATVDERVRAVYLSKHNTMPRAAAGHDAAAAGTGAGAGAGAGAAAAGFTSVDDDDTKRLRLSLVLDELSYAGDEAHLDLSKQHLQYVGDLAWSTNGFKALRVLNLSHNNLPALKGQGLGFLPMLQQLDLRHNQLTSLEDSLTQLEKCAKLQVLFLQNSHQGASTASPSSYVRRVTGRLRGLVSCDDIPSESTLCKSDEISALKMLKPACGVHANTVTNVNIREQGLGHKQFFPVLSGLAQLPVKNLRMDGNPWDTNCDGKGHTYRPYVISMIRGLRTLDGVTIEPTERADAVSFANRLPEEDRDAMNRNANFRLVEDASTLALAPAVPRFQAKQAAAFRAARGDSTGPEAVGVDPDFKPPAVEAATAVSGAQSDGAGAGAGAGASGSAPEEVKLDIGDDGSGVVSPGGATVTKPSAAAKLAGAPLDDVPQGCYLKKWELVFHFFQMYSVVLLLALGVEYSDLWRDVREYFDWPADVLSVDAHGIYGRTDPNKPREYEEYLRFGMVMAVPAVCLLLFARASTMTAAHWIGTYHTRWGRTRIIAVALLIVGLLAAFAAGFFADMDNAFDEITDGNTPPEKTSVYWAAAGSVVLLTFLIWIVCVAVFKRKYQRIENGNVVLGGESFHTYWASFSHGVQRFLLFLVVVFYLPVARAIIENFAGEYDSQTLQVYQCTFIDDDGYACCNAGYPSRPCINSPDFDKLSVLQYTAMGFGALYVIGIPLLVFRLARRGVRQVHAAFGHPASAINAQLKALEQRKWDIRHDGSTSPAEKLAQTKEAKATIAALKKKRAAFYAYHVHHSGAPETYLYQSYNRHWPHYKLLQMAEKLGALALALFLPADPDRYVHLVSVLVLVVVVGAIVIFTRAIVDPFEYTLDAVSRVAIIVNIVMALALDRSDDVPDLVTSIVLCVFNGVVVLAMVAAVFIMPCVQRRKPVPSGKLTSRSKAAPSAAGVTPVPSSPRSPTTAAPAGLSTPSRLVATPTGSPAGASRPPRVVTGTPPPPAAIIAPVPTRNTLDAGVMRPPSAEQAVAAV